VARIQNYYYLQLKDRGNIQVEEILLHLIINNQGNVHKTVNLKKGSFVEQLELNKEHKET